MKLETLSFMLVPFLTGITCFKASKLSICYRSLRMKFRLSYKLVVDVTVG